MNKEQEVIELLEQLEWSRPSPSLKGIPTCPICGTPKKIGKHIECKLGQVIARLKQPEQSHRRLGSMTMYPKPADSPPTSKKKTAPIIKPETGVKKGEVASQPPVISMKVAVDDCDILDKPPMREFTKELRALLDIPDDDSCKDESYRKDLENLVRLTCDRVDKVEAEKESIQKLYDNTMVSLFSAEQRIKELEAQIGEYSRKEK